MTKSVEVLKAELDAKYSAPAVAAKFAKAVAVRKANGGDVSMFPSASATAKAVRRTVTEMIADYLNITVDAARLVRDAIDEDGLLDWSEATTAECHRAYKEGYAIVMAGA